jgi:hypothetical protein
VILLGIDLPNPDTSNSSAIYYHGSTKAIKNPTHNGSRKATDFGKGFYVTPDDLFAKRWCIKEKNLDAVAIANKYELDLTNLKVKNFELNSDWLFMVIYNRAYKIRGVVANLYSPDDLHFFYRRLRAFYDISSDHDVISGPAADDQHLDTIEAFLSGVLTDKQAIAALECQELALELCLKSEKAISSLKFIGSNNLSYSKKSEIVYDSAIRRASIVSNAKAAISNLKSSGHLIRYYIDGGDFYIDGNS